MPHANLIIWKLHHRKVTLLVVDDIDVNLQKCNRFQIIKCNHNLNTKIILKEDGLLSNFFSVLLHNCDHPQGIGVFLTQRLFSIHQSFILRIVVLVAILHFNLAVDCQVWVTIVTKLCVKMTEGSHPSGENNSIIPFRRIAPEGNGLPLDLILQLKTWIIQLYKI